MTFRSAIAAAAAVLAAAGATAQIPTTTQDIIPSSSAPSRSETAIADQAFRDLVRCLVRYQPGRTRNLLDTVPGTQAEARILTSFESRMESCYNYYRTGRGALIYHGNLLRGVVAETYYAQAIPAGIGPARDVAPELAAQWAQPRPADGAITQMEMLHAMARCVTARQPAAVGTLLRTAPLSADERAAFRTLQADLSACLDSGVQFEGSRQSLRGLLAEAALHYGEAQRRGFTQPPDAAAGSE